MKARKPLFAVHVCCGKNRKVRFIDGEYVTQPHKCSDASDVAGIDWTAVKAEVNPEQKESA